MPKVAETDSAGTPVLRFPEFSGGWLKCRVGEFVTFQRGFDLPTEARKAGKVPIISSGGISGYHNEPKADPPGVVTGRYGSIGEIFYSPVPYWPLNTALWVNDFYGNSPLFAFYHLSRIDFKSLSDKTGVPGINRNEVHALRTSVPPLPEQQKIADFLGTVDAQVGLFRRRRDALRAYNKGMMQRLFSQELRFTKPDGSPFPSWQQKRLGDVAKIVGGGTPDTTEPLYWDGDIPWFTPTEIKTKYLTDSARTLSVDGLKQSSAKLLPVGTLLLSTRANVGDIGIALKECTTNQGFQAMIVNSDHSNEFWYYWIVFHKRKFIRWAAGSTFLEINKTEVSKISANVPHLEEQQKIAAALTALDAKIDAVTAQMDAMLRFKKGLLQQMFV